MNVHSSITQSSPNVETYISSIDEWIKKKAVSIQWNDSGIKRNEVPKNAKMWINIENMLSKRRQAEKTTYCMNSLI